MNVSTILFPTDFSPCAAQAMGHALRLAAETGAELHMLHVVTLLDDDPHSPGHHFPDREQVMAALERTAADRMESELAPHAGDLRVERVQRRGVSAAAAILEYASEVGADLVVMGTHGRRGFTHVLLGSVAEEVLRHAACAVLTVRELREPKPPEAIERILVPVDFSAPSRDAVRVARTLAAARGASVQLLHVVEEAIVPDFYMEGRVYKPLFSEDFRKRAVEALGVFAQEAGGPDAPMERFAVDGQATHEIVEFAREHGAGLVVISSHGLTGLAHLLQGSVAEKVARMAPCPVLTLKASAESIG